MKAELRLLSTLIQQKPSVHIEHPAEGILYTSASSLWGYGAAQKKQNCGEEELKSPHFATSSPLPSCDFLGNTPISDGCNYKLKKVATSNASCLPDTSPFTEDYPDLPAQFLRTLLPNPCLSKPDNFAKVIPGE